jgi:thiol-disulfide isomerase/thioredoxin
MKLNQYFQKALSYEQYTALLGDNLPLQQLHSRKFEPPTKVLEQLAESKQIKILVITEPWCSDSLALLPVVYKLSQSAKNWGLRIILRDQHPELIDQYLTNGVRAIPVFLFFDEQDQLLFRWGPRVKPAQKIFEQYREKIKSGEIEKQEVIKKIRTFYAKDRGSSALEELIPLVKNI